ncbi:hypothetical protein E2C01_027225 [Portunus trituberculatus]|uniref:Uncharacterized protein n=1 Tax=Portunus trituberculatus TaxID=210409 RepID=A0A5B7EKJ5_PORTR|nr:hypothetical protein [Portunus trituberculatus]
MWRGSSRLPRRSQFSAGGHTLDRLLCAGRPLAPYLHGSHRGGSVVLSVTRDVMGAARSAQTGITLRGKVAPTLLLNSCVCDHVVSFLL